MKVPVYPGMKERVPNACKNGVAYFTFACEETVKELRLYLEDRKRRYGTIESEDPSSVQSTTRSRCCSGS